jgi:hypothetical protein
MARACFNFKVWPCVRVLCQSWTVTGASNLKFSRDRRVSFGHHRSSWTATRTLRWWTWNRCLCLLFSRERERQLTTICLTTMKTCHGETNPRFLFLQHPQTRFRVEKYRPVSLDDVVSHKDITSTSQSNNFLSWVEIFTPHKSKNSSKRIGYHIYCSMDHQVLARHQPFLPWRDAYTALNTVNRSWK